MFFPTGLVASILILVSGYALIQSLTSIANIKKYEKNAERAADWSSTAKKRLWDTRYTIGTGFVSVSATCWNQRHTCASQLITTLRRYQGPFCFIFLLLFC